MILKGVPFSATLNYILNIAVHRQASGSVSIIRCPIYFPVLPANLNGYGDTVSPAGLQKAKADTLS